MPERAPQVSSHLCRPDVAADVLLRAAAVVFRNGRAEIQAGGGLHERSVRGAG